MENSSREHACPACGAVMGEQAREPKGVPNGGQFASSSRAESGVLLHDTTGSFLYPPDLKSADDIVDFWSSVEIPDVALARAQTLYRENVDMMREQWSRYAWDWYASARREQMDPRPDGDDTAAIAAWEGRIQSAKADYEEMMHRWLAEAPESIDRRDIRNAFRAAAMLQSANEAGLNREDYLRVAEFQMPYRGETKSAGAIAVETGLVGIANRFVDPEVYDPDGDGVIDPMPARIVPGAMSADFDWTTHREIVRQVVAEALGEHEGKLDAALDGIWSGIQDNARITMGAHGLAKPQKRRWSEM